jgi:hypothetical protein
LTISILTAAAGAAALNDSHLQEQTLSWLHIS